MNPTLMVLWKQLTPYLLTGMETLRDTGWNVHVWHTDTGVKTPFDDDWSSFAPTKVGTGFRESRSLWRDHETLRPHAVLTASWNVPAYMALHLALRGEPTLRLLASDATWTGTFRQRSRRRAARRLLPVLFDAAIVPGRRQVEFLLKMGLQPQHIRTGLFEVGTAERAGAAGESFLFVGRLAPEKGIETLLHAFRSYRRSGGHLGLRVAGTGPLLPVVEREPEVEALGFVDNRSVHELVARSRALLLPSRFEPWGVVVEEALSRGTPVAVSTAAGAAVLIDHGVNGYLVEPDDVAGWAAALRGLALGGLTGQLPAERRGAFVRAMVDLLGDVSPTGKGSVHRG